MAFSVSGSMYRWAGRDAVKRIALAALAVLAAGSAHAKEPALTAIELYNGPSGPAYVQVSYFLINEKAEVRLCGSEPRIDKSEYGKLTKVTLGPGVSIEAGKDGAWTLTQNGTSSCVVPSNLKFEKGAPQTPAELAALAELQGNIPGTASGPMPLKPGVKLVFVSAPDVELAEYLRAERASNTAFWQDYLKKYPSAPHSTQAKQSLASLLVQDGQASLDGYRKTSSTSSPAYAALQAAKHRADAALEVVPNYAAAAALNSEVHAELDKLVASGQKELEAYKQALSAHTSGYAHLTAASDLAKAAAGTDPHYPSALTLHSDTAAQVNALDSVLSSAESKIAAKRFDDAFAAVKDYLAFADEVPRIAAIVDAAYKSHYDRGQELAGSQDWEGAVGEFRKASDVKATAEAKEALNNAETSLENLKNKNATEAALQQSVSSEQQRDYIQAYEVLANLPAKQLSPEVKSAMDRLSSDYINTASKTARDLQRAHDPIRGLKDEEEIVTAYGYLKRAYALNSDPALNDRMESLADKLSAYYLEQAKRYLDKPLGSGVGLGESYLNKALPYKASNLDAIRDEQTKADAAFQMRSRLSIRVEFRDATSYRNSANYAEQLDAAIANGLESSGLPVKVIRPGENPPLEPNFRLVGEVRQHTRTSVNHIAAKPSQYRFASQDIPNPAWNKASHEVESAKMDLSSAQADLQGASAHGKKNEIATANNEVSAAKQRVEQAQVRLDAIPKTTPQDLKKPYNYTEKTTDMEALVELDFRLFDSLGNQSGEPIPVSKTDKRQYKVLSDVKPDDTEGIVVQGDIPDENQFFTATENEAQDTLVKLVTESVKRLPERIYSQARQLEDADDADRAAESYILYLNSTPSVQGTERQHAEQFLQTRYNIQPTATSPQADPAAVSAK
jgi:hypothetical protein